MPVIGHELSEGSDFMSTPLIVARDPSTGRVLVMDVDSGTCGLKVDGVWLPRVPTADDLKDTFEPVEDPDEALLLLKEAKAALG